MISSAAIWLRLGVLASFDEFATSSVDDGGWIVLDTALYLSTAVQIYSNDVPGPLIWPIGMPILSAFLFQWTGADLHAPRVVFAVLQALMGPLLFFCCLPAVKNKLLAFLPLLVWSVVS